MHDEDTSHMLFTCQEGVAYGIYIWRLYVADR